MWRSVLSPPPPSRQEAFLLFYGVQFTIPLLAPHTCGKASCAVLVLRARYVRDGSKAVLRHYMCSKVQEGRPCKREAMQAMWYSDTADRRALWDAGVLL